LINFSEVVIFYTSIIDLVAVLSIAYGLGYSLFGLNLMANGHTTHNNNSPWDYFFNGCIGLLSFSFLFMANDEIFNDKNYRPFRVMFIVLGNEAGFYSTFVWLTTSGLIFILTLYSIFILISNKRKIPIRFLILFFIQFVIYLLNQLYDFLM